MKRKTNTTAPTQFGVRTGKVHRPKHVTLCDVIAFVNNANRRESKILWDIIQTQAIGEGLGIISFGGIGLANVLSFVGSANKHERCQIKEVLKEATA
jgi:hypothetical protein